MNGRAFAVLVSADGCVSAIALNKGYAAATVLVPSYTTDGERRYERRPDRLRSRHGMVWVYEEVMK